MIGRYRAENRLVDRQGRADERGHGQEPVRRHARVDVDVRGTEDHAGLFGQQVRNAQPRPEREHDEERGGQQRQVAFGRMAGNHAAQRIEGQVAGGDMGAADAADRQNDRRQRDPVHEFQHRQPEQVERDVATKHRVGPAERRGVECIQPGRPGRGRVETNEQRGNERARVDERAESPGIDRDDARAVRRGNRELAAPEQAEREPQVEPEDDEDHRPDREAGRRLRRQRLEENLLVAQFLEPEPVGVELGERWNAREDEEGGEEEKEAGEPQSHPSF